MILSVTLAFFSGFVLGMFLLALFVAEREAG